MCLTVLIFAMKSSLETTIFCLAEKACDTSSRLLFDSWLAYQLSIGWLLVIKSI